VEKKRSPWFGPRNSMRFFWISTCRNGRIEVCRVMRQKRAPVADRDVDCAGSEDRKVEALDAGADDYITKPFQLRELTARLRAAIRRNNINGDGMQAILIGDVLMDPERHLVEKKGSRYNLTPKQFEVLAIPDDQCRSCQSLTPGCCDPSGGQSTAMSWNI